MPPEELIDILAHRCVCVHVFLEAVGVWEVKAGFDGCMLAPYAVGVLLI